MSEFIGCGVTDFVCGCEWGFSLFCAEIIIGMQGFNKSQLHIISPHENQPILWTDEIRDRYYYVHVRADSVRFISRKYHDDCYRICDKVIVDEGAMLFTDDDGGFAAQYAGINDKPVVVCESMLRNSY